MQWSIHTWRLKVQVNYKEVENFVSTKCGSCEFGKGCFLPDKIKRVKDNTAKGKDLKMYHILPGQMVSSDHYISRNTCRIFHTRGKWDPY